MDQLIRRTVQYTHPDFGFESEYFFPLTIFLKFSTPPNCCFNAWNSILVSISKSPIGEQAIVYVERSNGLCTDVGKYLELKNECDESAKLMPGSNWVDKVATPETDSDYPRGCYTCVCAGLGYYARRQQGL